LFGGYKVQIATNTKTMIKIIFGVRFLLITSLKYRIAYRFNGCEIAG